MSLSPELVRSLEIGHRRSRVAANLFGLCAVISLAQIVSYVMQLWLIKHMQADILPPEAFEANNQRLDVLDYSARVFAVISMIFFLRWLHRAVRNAQELRPESLIHTNPKNVVLSFFIPFANLFRPVVEIRALDRAIDPEAFPLPVTVIENPNAGYREPARTQVVIGWTRVKAPIALWWAFWLLPALHRFFPGPPSNAPLEEYIQATWVAVLFTFIALIGDLLSLAVVRGINARMKELARRLAHSSEELTQP